MNQLFKRNLSLILTLTVYLFFTIWWVYLHLTVEQGAPIYDIYSDTYGVLAGLGGLIGLTLVGRWGGFKSYMGKALILFSSGLLFQFIGQLIYTLYFFLLHIEVPYPSIGDIFFFGSIPIYILGIWYLAKASGCGLGFSKTSSRLLSVLLPIILLAISYYIFLKDYEVDMTQPLTVFLDFGYPLGQSLYLSVAILTYILSRDVLGGVMRPRILIILIALVVQYIADFVFLYLQSRDLWLSGGISELLYLNAYFFMALGLMSIGTVYDLLSAKPHDQVTAS